MDKVVYRELASRIIARDNCAQAGKIEWFDKHQAVIDDLLHSSRFDLTGAEYNNGRLIITGRQFCMDENGYTLGYYDYTITVYPNLALEFSLAIDCHGNKPLYEYRDYIRDGISDWLYWVVDLDKIHAEAQ